MKFEVWVRKKGNTEMTLLATFPTLQEAKDFVDKHKDEYTGWYILNSSICK